MENINNELGIPVQPLFEDLVSLSGYDNASGRQRRQERRTERRERRQERREDRRERRQERREGRNTQRVTTGDRTAAEQWVMTSFGNSLLSAKSVADLDYWIGVMSDQKANSEEMLGKRKSGVGRVLSFGRQYKRRGKNAGLCTSDQCIRENQARLDALNNFETKHRTAVDALRKKLEALENPPVTEGGSTTTTGTTSTTTRTTQGVGGGSLTGGTPSGSIISGGGLSSIMSNEQATGTTTTGSDELQPSDKQKKTLVFIVGGLVVLGAGYYFLTKK
jgi:hypothetical protein